MIVLCDWQGLPHHDPAEKDAGRTIHVRVVNGAWSHIVEKHFSNAEEPWNKCFSQGGVSQGNDPSQQKGDPPSGPVLAFVKGQIEAALSRPLVLAFRIRSRQGRQIHGWPDRWILVLPCGAQAILAGHGSKYQWLTCYFPRAAVVVQNGAKRWIATVRHLLTKYLRLVGSPPQFVAPSPDDVFEVRSPSGEVKEELWRIRFWTPQSWGFIQLGEQYVWRCHLETWPAAEAFASPAKRGLRRLHKPFDRDDDG